MGDDPFCFTTFPGEKRGVLIVKLVGPLILKNLFGFQAPFREMKPLVLILDLSDSKYMDSAGLGVIMNQYVAAQTGQRKFLIAGVSGRILALMELTRVTTILKIYPSVEAAEDEVWTEPGF
jgi:anti-anti-sigma factor